MDTPEFSGLVHKPENAVRNSFERMRQMGSAEKVMNGFADQMLNNEPPRKRGFFIAATTGEVTAGLINNVILSYQNYILTQFVQLSTTVTANILAIMNFIQLIFCPLGGAFYDRFRFKSGAKYWPWFFIVPLSIAIVNVCMTASVAFNGSKWLTAVLMIAGVACGNIFLFSLVKGIFPSLSNNDQERTIASTWSNVWKEVSKYAAMSLAPSLMIMLSVSGEEWDPQGLFYTTLIYSVAGVLVAFFTGIVFKKGVEDKGKFAGQVKEGAKKAGTSVFGLLKQVFTNKTLLLIFVIIIFSNSRSYSTLSLHTYYYQFVWEDPSAMAAMRLWGQIVTIVATFCVPFLKRRVFKETKSFYLFTMICVSACQFLTGLANTYIVYEIIEVVEYFVFGFKGVMDVLLFTIAVDVIRYEAFEKGETSSVAQGAVMSLFASALAGSKIICGYVVNFILAACGYQAGVISESFVETFPIAYSVVPGCLTLVSVLLMLFFYRFKDGQLASMRREMHEAKLI